MRNILIPLMHIGGGDSAEKAVETEVQTAVMKAMERESRVVFQYNHELERSAKGLYNVQGTMQYHVARYCMNMLQTVTGFLFNLPDVALYAAHTLKRMDILKVTSFSEFIVETKALDYYLWQTAQTAQNFVMGCVFDTGYTVHTAVTKLAAVDDGESGLSTVTVLEGGPLPFGDMRYIEQSNGVYPVHIETTSASLKVSVHGGECDFSFGGRVMGTENKRAVL